ncbi:beta-propeller domain-containing protein [Spirillospora sp. NPDC047279]|uniref:beta-propeller domain-containing protein n=1 Tax=Spirillospora sp. NPDC047279 TaxID=3155478 RepID=UPI0033D0DF35
MTALPVVSALLVAGCSGGDDPAGRQGGTVDAPPMRLVAYDDCDDLLGGLRDAAAKQVTPYGLDGNRWLMKVPEGAVPGAPAPEAADGARGGAESGAQSRAGKSAQDFSGTNVHEAGADEPDLVKTDGRRIVTIARNRLQVIDPATKKVAHRLDLPVRGPGMYAGDGDSQLLLNGDRALVLTRRSPVGIDTMTRSDVAKPLPGRTRSTTTLTLVDLGGPPKVAASMTADGDFVDARQTGSVARIVVKNRPDIDFPQSPHNGDNRTALERNRRIVRQAPLSAWLPKVEVRNGSDVRSYTTPCGQVSRPASYTGTTMLSILTVDLAKGLGDPDPVAVAADGQTVYGNGASLYVTGTPPQPGNWGDVVPKQREQRTDVHKFDVRGQGRPAYAASGSVPGELLNQYSLSEHAGNLRIATTSTPQVGPERTGDPITRPAPQNRSQSAVRVLAQRGSKLTTIGEIGGLGKGERIYSVRFIGDKGYVVTFRQVDPLYVLDLKDPARPRGVGELKITGYSAYLHPTADGKLLGVGQDADENGRTLGTQVSLFDVSGAPRRLDSFKLPGTSTLGEYDPHAFLYWPRTGLTVLPVNGHRGGGGALVLSVNADGISRTGEVEHPSARSEIPVQILRSLLVGDTLWTISSEGARATGASTLDDQGWLRF